MALIEHDDYGEWDDGQVAFARERHVACTRKEHRCEVCHYAIPAGMEAIAFARKDEDTPERRIDYGYICSCGGPCFDPEHPRPARPVRPMEETDDLPF